MVDRFLITTALEETWRDDGPTLFLGEWCRRRSRREHWSGIDAEVLPYHWDDRNRLYHDYRYLRDLHERLLVALGSQLNEIHDVDHSVRYWRIVLGPWLGYFTQMFYDRWTSIQTAVNQFDVTNTVVLTGHEHSFVPNDMAEFLRLLVSDEWNHHIYSTILRYHTDTPYTLEPRNAGFEAPEPRAANPWRLIIKSVVVGVYSRVAQVFGRATDAFFLDTYMSVSDELLLYRRLRQVPRLRGRIRPDPVDVDGSRRTWVVGGESRSPFEECVFQTISGQLPRLYLEGYHDLIEQIDSVLWPKNPKVIWTSNAFIGDDVFKAWAADKAERGRPLVIGQHGGNYGIGQWHFSEEHEIEVADRYLTWGWSDPDQPKIVAMGQLKMKRPTEVHSTEQSGLLLATSAFPRYSYHLYSSIVARQWIDYFEDQCEFVESLPQRIRDTVTVRLYPDDYGWDQTLRWGERFPKLRLDAGATDMEGLIRSSRLCVSTSNATTFLESISMDVPTVIYWNPAQWELRDAAQPFFDDLAEVGVFHITPASAATHVAAIWDDIDGWWNAPAVKGATERFREVYCKTPDDLVDRLADVFQDISRSGC